MSGMCINFSWTCRPVWLVLIVLLTLPYVLHCSDSPAAPVGKMYPRGNHWAVGHLMGKKSTDSLQKLRAVPPPLVIHIDQEDMEEQYPQYKQLSASQLNQLLQLLQLLINDQDST